MGPYLPIARSLALVATLAAPACGSGEIQGHMPAQQASGEPEAGSSGRSALGGAGMVTAGQVAGGAPAAGQVAGVAEGETSGSSAPMPQAGSTGSSAGADAGPADTGVALDAERSLDGAADAAPDLHSDAQVDADPSSDAGALDAGGEPAGEPVFVAIGDGGWIATSCDLGRSWSTQALSGTTGDLTHSPWAAFGGVAFAGGRFVAGFGWGQPGALLSSGDGRSFMRLGDGAFSGPGVSGYGQVTAAVAHNGRDFLVYNSRFSMGKSSDGLRFQKVDPTLPSTAEQIRQLRGFPSGLVVAAVENQSGSGRPAGRFVLPSEDGGDSWYEGTGLDSDCTDRIQIQGGDIEYAAGVLMVAAETMCRSIDRGRTWQALGSPVGDRVRDVFHDGTRFLAVAGSRLFESGSGERWSELASVGSGLRFAEAARGVIVVVNDRGTAFYYSHDGRSFQSASIVGTARSGAAVRDLYVGHYERACP